MPEAIMIYSLMNVASVESGTMERRRNESLPTRKFHLGFRPGISI